jgi:hypothetical protein
LGGTLWLVFLETHFKNDAPPNRFRQVGYGFFLGYSVLFLAVITGNKLIGAVFWPGLMWFLLLFALCGGILVWRDRKPIERLTQPSRTGLSGTTKLLMVTVLALMSVHVVFIGVEVLTREVYPWDAWGSWVYRAKAWFFADSISAVVSSADWVTAPTAEIYTIHAWLYPLFPSVIPYWAALSLGKWSETLVNLPVLLAGMAIGMALYGQCRENGISVMASLITCYFLFSIPLFGTHLALAGYADTWMAAYVGLGFIALMQGILKQKTTGQPRTQIAIGILMIAFSILVKNEGAVWFLAAIAIMILATWKPRNIIILLVTTLLLALLSLSLGIYYIDIPLIGHLGFIDERLIIPFIGVFPLEFHDIRDAYWNNFFRMGSWNLLWPIVTATLLIGLRSMFVMRNDRTGRTVASFILIFVATQVFIFGFTNQGVWADTYTALNRLPLHFVPALLFTVAVIAKASLKQSHVDNTTTETSSGRA